MSNQVPRSITIFERLSWFLIATIVLPYVGFLVWQVFTTPPVMSKGEDYLLSGQARLERQIMALQLELEAVKE